MSPRDEERQLWQLGPVSCVMMSCCSGAELQVRKHSQSANDEEIVLRELYPTKSDLYERARELAAQYKSLVEENPERWNPEPGTQNLEPRT